jgi:flagellar protein FlbD
LIAVSQAVRKGLFGKPVSRSTCDFSTGGGGNEMIRVHRLNGEEFILNPNHIELVEARPDTVITLTNEHKYVVSEPVEDILGLIRDYYRSLFSRD